MPSKGRNAAFPPDLPSQVIPTWKVVVFGALILVPKRWLLRSLYDYGVRKQINVKWVS